MVGTLDEATGTDHDGDIIYQLKTMFPDVSLRLLREALAAVPPDSGRRAEAAAERLLTLTDTGDEPSPKKARSAEDADAALARHLHEEELRARDGLANGYAKDEDDDAATADVSDGGASELADNSEDGRNETVELSDGGASDLADNSGEGKNETVELSDDGDVDAAGPDEILAALETLRREFPDLNPDAAYARLEQSRDLKQTLSEIRREQTPPDLNKSNSEFLPMAEGADDEALTGHEAIRVELERLLGDFPDLHADAAYARLEDSDDLKRTAFQIRQELTRPEEAAEDDQAGPSNAVPPELAAQLKVDASIADEFELLKSFLSKADRASLEGILRMFPSADPKWVFDQMTKEGRDAEGLTLAMSADPTFPKLASRVAEKRKDTRRAFLTSGDSFDAAEYLRLYEDPEKTWSDVSKVVSNLYLSHASVAILNAFPELSKTYLDRAMAASGNHYYPTYKRIQEDKLKNGGVNRRDQHMYLKKKRVGRLEWPARVDEVFFREYQYAHFKERIAAYQDEQARIRAAALAKARRDGTLKECEICADDEVLPGDLVACQGPPDSMAAQHTFCRNCVRAHATTQIGDEGHCRVGCMAGAGCAQAYSAQTLQEILAPSLGALMLRRVQQDELKAAGLEDLAACPFCDYVQIMENAGDRLFKCLNPDCLKESCRECSEESHIPLKCSEVEKGVEVKMRTAIENAMAEALIRKCPKCARRIVKETGCNHMTCPCGAHMCYICSAALDQANPYGHFAEGGVNKASTCRVQSNIHTLHEAAAKKAGEEAKAKLEAENPGLDLGRVDVAALVAGVTARPNGGDPFDEDYDSEDEDDYEEEEVLPGNWELEAAIRREAEARRAFLLLGADSDDELD